MAGNSVQPDTPVISNTFRPPGALSFPRFAPAFFEAASSVLLGAAGLACSLLVWWFVSLGLDPLRLPSPWAVAQAITENWANIPALQYVDLQSGGLADALFYTVTSVLVMVAVGAISGTLAGIALPLVSVVYVVVSPFLVVLGSMPILILLPFLVEWFGNGGLVRSGIVVIFTFVVMASVCMRASHEAAGRYRNYALSLGAGPAFEMFHVVLPALLPDLIAGLRVCLASAWSMESVAEVIGGQQGAGRVIATMAHLSNTEVLLAMVVCIALAAVILDGLLVVFGKGFVTWQE